MFKKYDNFRTSEPVFTVSKFWMFSRRSLVRTSEPMFIKVQSEFAEVKSKKVTKRVVSILDVLKDPSEHAEVRR